MKTKIRKQESEFKDEMIRTWRKEGRYTTILCIESDETAPGFPDVFAYGENGLTLYEFKSSKSVSDGTIKFKKTQPRFYLEHPELPIYIVAYDNRNGKVHIFPSWSLFDIGNYQISKSFTVRLPI